MKTLLAKLINSHTLEFAPGAVYYQDKIISNPSENLLKELGYLEVKDVPPAPPAEQHVIESYWEIDGDFIIKKYRYEKDPPRNLNLSKRKLMNNLRDLKLWDTVKGWIESKNMMEDWLYATTLDEQDPMMQEAIQGLIISELLTKDQIDDVLIRSEYTTY